MLKKKGGGYEVQGAEPVQDDRKKGDKKNPSTKRKENLQEQQPAPLPPQTQYKRGQKVWSLKLLYYGKAAFEKGCGY